MVKKKKKKLKIGNLLIVLTLIIGLFIFIGNGITNNKDKSDNPKVTEKKKEDEEKEQVYTISLLATGDGLVHERVYQTYQKNDGTYDFSPALSEVKDIVSKYDIAYYNQETPMGDNSLKYSGYPLFYAPSAFGDAMIDIGFNTISLASNHSWDKGYQGIINTLNYFKNTDCLYDGMNANETREYQIKEKNNITYTMLSYTTIDNGMSNSNTKYLVNIYDLDKVKADIEAVRDKVDLLIVAMHWGVEYQNTPNESQKEIANYLASLGVDIIIGNHPHVLQPITWIDDTLVMYSLGNFISNQYSNSDYSKLVSVLATVDITKTIDKDKTMIKIDNLGGELIFTHYDTEARGEPYNDNHQVIPFSQMNDETYLKDYKRIYEKYSNVLKSMGTAINIAPLGS